MTTKGDGLNKGGRGRKTPVAVREAQGNPGKRAMPKGIVEPLGELTRPDHVTDYAADTWDRLIGSMPVGVFKSTDRDALAAYCLAAQTMRTATFALVVEGEVVGGRLNPWVRVQNNARAQVITLGTQLGLTPIARENIAQPPAPKGGKWSGLLAINGGKAD